VAFWDAAKNASLYHQAYTQRTVAFFLRAFGTTDFTAVCDVGRLCFVMVQGK
jgi:hypothetical protein